MHLNGRPVVSVDPEGLIFAAGVDSRQLKLYDLRTFDKVIAMEIVNTLILLTDICCRGHLPHFMCGRTLRGRSGRG